LLGTCLNCESEFTYYPSNKSGNFCSQKCYYEYYRHHAHPLRKRMTVNCENCGKELSIAPCRKKNHNFCSQACLHKWQSSAYKGEGNPRYNKGKKTYICQYCGKEFVDIHYVKYRKYCSDKCRLVATRPLAIRGLLTRPTRPEQFLIDLIRKHDLPFRYVGDGRIGLDGKHPDFIECNGAKKVIEIFGNHWHSPLFNPSLRYTQTFFGTLEHYEKNGYACLILWDSELKEESEVVKKINDFVGGGHGC